MFHFDYGSGLKTRLGRLGPKTKKVLMYALLAAIIVLPLIAKLLILIQNRKVSKTIDTQVSAVKTVTVGGAPAPKTAKQRQRGRVM